MRSNRSRSWSSCKLTVSNLEMIKEQNAARLVPYVAPVEASLDDFTSMQVIALMLMTETQVKRAIVAKLLEQVQDRPSLQDYHALVEKGFAEKRAADKWHRLTGEGSILARRLTEKLCKDFDIHLLIEGSAAGSDVAYSCPCGWSTHVGKGRFTYKNAMSRFLRHSATAEGMRGLQDALAPEG